MKTLSLVLLSILLLCIVALNDINWNQYIGKRVIVEINSMLTYRGIVNDIVRIEKCLAKDPWGDCLCKKDYYTMFLIDDYKRKIILRCEFISRIEELVRS